MYILLVFSKIFAKLIRLFKLGGGTALPGLFIEKYFPSSLRSLTKNYKKIVLITGTNGKTTTQKLLRHLLEQKGYTVTSNTSGANLIRGIAISIISDTNIFGRVKKDIAVFEVEEATMPMVTKYISADYIIVTNLFRDQLDAYGEIVKTRSYILEAIKSQPKAKVSLLHDDDNVSSIADEIPNDVKFFTVRDKRTKSIFYERSYFKTKFSSSDKPIVADNIRTHSDLSTTFDIKIQETVFNDIRFSSPGVHYVFNAVAAIGVATDLSRFSNQDVRIAFEKFRPAFGRGELVSFNNKSVRILLIKNPASFTANLFMLRQQINVKLLIVINDNIADGTDVSWLWDAKLEVLQKAKVSWITVSGTRAYDMFLRLKYASFGSMNVEVEPNLTKAIDISLQKLNHDETLFVLPTYTAMLDVRRKLSKFVKMKEFWKD